MQQMDETVKCRPWMFPFSNEGTKKFQEVGWNLKDQRDSKKETSKRLTEHHEPSGNTQCLNWVMSI